MFVRSATTVLAAVFVASSGAGALAAAVSLAGALSVLATTRASSIFLQQSSW